LPATYTCKKCKIKGHYFADCPRKNSNKGKAKILLAVQAILPVTVHPHTAAAAATTRIAPASGGGGKEGACGAGGAPATELVAGGSALAYGASFSTEIHTRGYHWFRYVLA
jgi:hypothetical protein